MKKQGIYNQTLIEQIFFVTCIDKYPLIKVYKISVENDSQENN